MNVLWIIAVVPPNESSQKSPIAIVDGTMIQYQIYEFSIFWTNVLYGREGLLCTRTFIVTFHEDYN